MGTLWQDLRYGARMLLKRPGFAALAALTLAVGIGANTAIFSVVNTVLLRPLPYSDPDRLMLIRETKLPQFPEFAIAPGNFLDWQSQQETFDRFEAFRGFYYNLTGTGAPERLRASRVTAGLFPTLGVQPALGRDFLAEEDRPGSDAVVIISHGLWQRRFGGDANIVGQPLQLNGRSYQVIGVMPESLRFLDRNAELWTPIAFTDQERQNHGGHYISAIARLKPGVTPEQAQTNLATIAARLEQQYPDTNAGWGIKLIPLFEAAVGEMRPTLWVLLGAVALVLLIACANVANLLLARASSRHKEIAIRSALGASRRRLVRQLLTESLLLALVGGAVGVLLAYWGLDLLLSLAPENLPRMRDVSLDARALGYTFAVTLLTGVIFGLAPALQSSNPDLNETLKEGGRGSTGGRRQRVRSLLVVTEVALALVLLAGAGLMLKSFWRLQQVDPGFNAENALVVNVNLPPSKYADAQQQAAFFRQLLERTATLPGVQAVGATQSMPIINDFILGLVIEGRPPAAPGDEPSTNYYAISPDYFRAMGIPLIRGRAFTERDTTGAPRVAIVNETFARRFFPDEDPIGKRIHVTNGPETFREIVGIVGDVRHYGLEREAPAQAYEPYLQQPFAGMSIVVRTAADPANLSAAMRQEVFALDKDQPVASVRTLEEILAESVAQRRFSMFLLGLFGGIALLLASVGIFGVMNYTVAQRTHEIGIRLALGAQRRDILRLVVGQGMGLALIGVALGLVAAFAGTRVMASMLYGVSATDPLTFTGVALLLAVVAFLACYLPARRATKVDPMIALRYE